MHDINSSSLDKQKEAFMSEKKELVEKIENITSELNKVDRENSNLNQTKEQIAYKLKQKQDEFDGLKEETSTQSEKITADIETIKAKLSETNDELVKEKLGTERETALTDQKI